MSSPHNRYLLANHLVFQGDPNQDVTYHVDGSLTTTDLDGNANGYSLNLRDCRLYINGDLDLGLGGLQGENATLIVNGHVVLRDGNMEASERGLVIMCGRLCVSTVGTYRGLILVRDCCAFTGLHPANSQLYNPLEIRGVIICGGGSAELRLASQTANPAEVMIA